ncbi:SSI family serine proteinase inhibitor [Salininema proteolyticum]|uniref:SSI family serine proteinase inhibitor n=1 Tax=Salininema proteolyticum TaxID=1607685 RepID=A0ABV8U3J6_9ACTN
MRRRITTALIAGAVAMLLSSTPAQAQPMPDEASTFYGSFDFTVIEYPSREFYRATLECPSARGSHPHGGQACIDIAKFNGDFKRLDLKHPSSCTTKRPVLQVKVRGKWNNAINGWIGLFESYCHLKAAGGPIFDLR